jgi:hypothetical protein
VREVVDADRLRRFMQALGREARVATRIFLVGGASAVLLGWRDTTIDVDLKMVPEHEELFRAIPILKERLRINVEIASPGDFIPVPAGWEDRSPFIVREGQAAFHHFDFYSQALAKLERHHQQDVQDVREMVDRGLLVPRRALDFYDEIEPGLYRFPAVDPATFRAAVEAAFGDRAGQS